MQFTATIRHQQVVRELDSTLSINEIQGLTSQRYHCRNLTRFAQEIKFFVIISIDQEEC